MPRMKQHTAGEDGWSAWDTPIMTGYRLGCCDCGLVHDMEFRVLRVTKHNPDGSWESEPMDASEYRVELRARRNARSTAQVRRHITREGEAK